MCFLAHSYLSSKYQYYWYVNKLDYFLKNNGEIPTYIFNQSDSTNYISGETVTVLAKVM